MAGQRTVGRMVLVVALALTSAMVLPGIAAGQTPTQDSVTFVGDPGPLIAPNSRINSLNATSGPRGENPSGFVSTTVWSPGSSTLPDWLPVQGAVACLLIVENTVRINFDAFAIQVTDRPDGDVFSIGLSGSSSDCSGQFEPRATGSVPPTADIRIVDAPGPHAYYVHPRAGAFEVHANQPVVAVFNVPMNQAATGEAFSLTGPGGENVEGSLSWYGPRTLVFTPAANLTKGATYTANISTEARDLSGNPLAEARTWSFTVSPYPTIEAIWPAANQTNVPTSAAAVAVFTYPMDQQATAAAFTLREAASGDLVPGTVAWYGPRAAAYVPSSPLEPGTRYTAQVLRDARDVDGSPLGNSQVWSFTTAASAATAARALNLTAPPLSGEEAGKGSIADMPDGVRRALRRDGMLKRGTVKIERRLQHELGLR